jgi:hypothetical protein
VSRAARYAQRITAVGGWTVIALSVPFGVGAVAHAWWANLVLGLLIAAAVVALVAGVTLTALTPADEEAVADPATLRSEPS